MVLSNASGGRQWKLLHPFYGERSGRWKKLSDLLCFLKLYKRECKFDHRLLDLCSFKMATFHDSIKGLWYWPLDLVLSEKNHLVFNSLKTYWPEDPFSLATIYQRAHGPWTASGQPDSHSHIPHIPSFSLKVKQRSQKL